MNILMLTNDYPPLIGGIAAHVHHLSKALSKAGHRVHLVVPTAGDPDRLVTEHTDGRSVHRWGFRYSRNMPLRAYRIDRAARKAAAAAMTAEGPFDLVHQQDVRATKPAASAIAKKFGIPLVWTYHSPQMWTGRDRWNHLFLKGIRFNPDGIITVSRELRQRAMENWGDHVSRIHYIPNGVDLDRFQPRGWPVRHPSNLHPDDFILFCPSRMVPKKGIRYLAEAMKSVVREGAKRPIRLLLFGESPLTRFDPGYYSDIRASLGELNDDRVLFTDYVSYSEMPDYFALSDLVVLPSLKEAVNLSMLEAMAMKRPVLASEVGGMAEVIEHGETGWLVPPADPKALADAMLHLYRNPVARENIAENGYRLVRANYGWNRIAERTGSFYEAVLRGGT